jgi:hypothetical protein
VQAETRLRNGLQRNADQHRAGKRERSARFLQQWIVRNGWSSKAVSDIKSLHRHGFRQFTFNQPSAKEVHRAHIVANDVDHEHVPATRTVCPTCSISGW